MKSLLWPTLLRTPPWPGADAVAASIAFGRPPLGRANFDVDAVATAMVTARVGGSFWGAQYAGRRRLIVLGGSEVLPAGHLGDAVVIPNSGKHREAARRGALVVGRDADPWPLIEAAETVSCPWEDEIGILALAGGRSVHSQDGDWTDRKEILGKALLDEAYRNVQTHRPISVFAAIEQLAQWRLLIDGNRGLVAAAGIAFWKRDEVERLLWDGRSSRFPFYPAALALMLARRQSGAVAAWPARVPVDFAGRAAKKGVPVRWVEDGFIRSAGLGSDLTPPLSLSVDDLRPYFDPTGPSRLEAILATTDFDAALLARADALRTKIVAGKIGKYHAGDAADALTTPPDKRVVLVVGQVEGDLSVLRGATGDIRTNLDLLKRVRAEEDGAYIIYRPHPDVEAGHRRGAIPDALAHNYADRIMRGGSIEPLLAVASRVHVLTSLTGLEALLRGCTVVVHGVPFYAGWGLTEDRVAIPRRTRKLQLNQLIAGGIMLYPRYLDPLRGLPCSPEAFIDGITGTRSQASWLVRMRRWQGRLSRAIGLRA